jgi:hypothetical protein
VYAERLYGIRPEQGVGTAGGTKFGYAKDGKPLLTKEPKLVLNDNDAGTGAVNQSPQGRALGEQGAEAGGSSGAFEFARPRTAPGHR